MPVYEINTDRGTFEIDADREPTQAEALAAIENVPRGTIPTPPTFAEDRFTPLQQAAISGLGPLGPLAAQLTGRPVTQTEAAAEGALERIGSLPGSLLSLVSMPGTPLGALRQLLPGGVESGLQRGIQAVTDAPITLEQALGVGPSIERATFREPTAGAVGEIGGEFFPPVAAAERGGVATGKAVSEALQAGAAPLKAMAAPFERALARVTPTANQSAMSALRITAEEAERILPSAVPNLSKAAGKATPNTLEILEAAPKARKSLFDEATTGLTRAKDQGLVVKGNLAFDDVTAAIESDSRFMLDEPEAAKALIEKYEKYNRDIDTLEARKFLEDTNGKLISHWDKTAKGQKLDLTDAELRAERALAANLSGQVDVLYKIGSRKNGAPYRDVGKIIEFEKNLKLEQQAAEQAFARRVAPTRVQGEALPLGKGEAIRKVGRGLTTPFRKTELELLDKRMKETFKGTSKQPAADDIPEDFISNIRQGFLKSPPPLPVEAVAPMPVAPTVGDLIPASLRRSDPELARILAQQGQLVPPTTSAPVVAPTASIPVVPPPGPQTTLDILRAFKPDPTPTSLEQVFSEIVEPNSPFIGDVMPSAAGSAEGFTRQLQKLIEEQKGLVFPATPGGLDVKALYQKILDLGNKGRKTEADVLQAILDTYTKP